MAKLAGLPPSVISRAKLVLDNLEKGEKSKTIENLSDDLPLFQNVENKEVGPQISPNEKLISHLADVNVDDLSPREALEIVYTLKELADS